MDGMDDLVQFLRARLDEAHEDALRGYLKVPEDPSYNGWDKRTTAGLPPLVARQTLAEIDAKREVVNAYERMVAEFQDSGPAMVSYDRLVGSVSSLRTALKFLALPYADHPDYRDMWRP